MTICANVTYRKTKEEHLIYKHGTLEARGTNVRFHSFPVSIETPYLHETILKYLLPCFFVMCPGIASAMCRHF